MMLLNAAPTWGVTTGNGPNQPAASVGQLRRTARCWQATLIHNFINPVVSFTRWQSSHVILVAH
jgi:hypothetical protein